MLFLKYVICLFVLFESEVSGGRNVNITELDSRYDSIQRDLICYSSADKYRVVRCRAGCVQKSIISSYKVDGIFQTDFYHRLGCESRTFDDTLLQFKCNPAIKNGSPYTLDYMLEGHVTRDKPRIWIRKTCCFNSKCNVPIVNALRFWFKQDESLISVLRSRFHNSQSALVLAVYSMAAGLAVYGIITYVLKWYKSKSLAENGPKRTPELEWDIILESDFDRNTIIDMSRRITRLRCCVRNYVRDTMAHGSEKPTGRPRILNDRDERFITKLEVTGRLTIKETAKLLSRLPDMDMVRYKHTKTKSFTEESTRDTKTSKNQLPTVVESDVGVDGKKMRRVSIGAPLKTKAAGWGHTLWNTIRTINSPYDLLYRMIEHGPYQYPFTAMELLTLFEETAFKMAEESSLLQIDAEIIVIADLRGRYVDLHRWLQLTGWPPSNRILFLGGILDNNEPGSVECLALICSLKCRFPKHVYLLRGEPETSPFRMSQRLHPVITRAVQSCIKRMCSQMPFAAIIGKSVLCVYSGFSPMVREKAHIRNLLRPATSENLNAVERHIIFNQPSNRVRIRSATMSGRSFREKQTEKETAKKSELVAEKIAKLSTTLCSEITQNPSNFTDFHPGTLQDDPRSSINSSPTENYGHTFNPDVKTATTQRSSRFDPSHRSGFRLPPQFQENFENPHENEQMLRILEAGLAKFDFYRLCAPRSGIPHNLMYKYDLAASVGSSAPSFRQPARRNYSHREFKKPKRRNCCSFCYGLAAKKAEEAGEPIADRDDDGPWSNHQLKSDGAVSCPVLRAVVCNICGATGETAHTTVYHSTNPEKCT
uniref:Nanos-type domain-containing protein n=1 Tax=Caenorhabditis japonica TaxID=281687 RepID=A0A8R1DFE9_CAEJA